MHLAFYLLLAPSKCLSTSALQESNESLPMLYSLFPGSAMWLSVKQLTLGLLLPKETSEI